MAIPPAAASLVNSPHVKRRSERMNSTTIRPTLKRRMKLAFWRGAKRRMSAPKSGKKTNVERRLGCRKRNISPNASVNESIIGPS
jgi:hypothetical protein